MVLHSTLSGADLHDPKGVSPTPVVIVDNVGSAYLIEDDNGDAYFDITTTNSSEAISLGNTTTNPDVVVVGTGEMKADVFVVRELASAPSTSSLVQVGKLYSKDVSGQTELHYIDEDGNETQITSAGSIAGAGGGTLDSAYDYGGAHLGRQINIDSGFPVQLTGSGISVAALETTGFISMTTTDTVVGGSTHGTPSGNSTIFGYGSTGNGAVSVSVGYSTTVTAADGVAIGAQATAGGGARAIAIGRLSTAGSADSVAIGRSAATTSTNQVVWGSNSYYYTEYVVGGGVTDTNTRTLNLHTSDASGTDVEGWALQLGAGRGTGTGPGGRIALRTSPPGSTGSSLNSWFDAMGVDPETGTACPNGEAFIATNTTTDPRRYTSGATSVSSVSGGTHNVVDVGNHTNNTSQMGWIQIQVTVLAQGTANAETYFLANSFILNSSGTLTVGTAVKYATSIAIGSSVLTDADIISSGTAIQVDWTASSSDNYDVVWSAEWHFGPAPNIS